ncbi:MAG: hypothetical protein P8101_01890 [Candidatus Thiodiazotropha sp.]
MKIESLRNSLFLILTLLALRLDAAGPIQSHEIPEPLRPWQAWVSWSHPDLNCPFLSTGSSRQCVWSNQLKLDLNPASGHFVYQASVFADSLVPLPGNRDHWPENLQLDGSPAVLLDHQGEPAVRLAPGDHTLSGDFRWGRLPDTLAVPPQTGIVQLRLNGKAVTHPVLRKGNLWLKTQTDENTRRQPEDSVKMRLFRLLDDGHPFTVETLMDVRISGAQRELVLGKPLLEGFIPTKIESALPARLEPNGDLRIQARPGSWQVRLFSRHVAPVTQLRRVVQGAPWPGEEIWAFRAEHQLRVVEVSGPAQIDSRQVDLPDTWSSLPAYLMQPEDLFSIKEVRRANAQAEADQLNLERNIWLDFDAQGYTLQDRMTGSLNSRWRLSVDPILQLGRVTLNGVPQLITHLPGSELAGVEVRHGNLDLEADIRVAQAGFELPVSGWDAQFQHQRSTLHLPPGWRLLAVGGVDNVPRSWIQQWTLYDLFLVLIATLAASRLWGWLWAIPILMGLVLTWQEPLAPQWVWLYLLMTIALGRVAPAGRLQKWVRGLRLSGYLALILAALPFLVTQARFGLHPQLERYAMTPSYALIEPQVLSEPAPAAAPSRALSAPRLAKPESDLMSVGKMQRPSYRVLDEVDPNAIVQTGPGLPAWEWNRVDLIWNGPVAAGQTLHLYVLSPLLTSILRFVAIGLVLLMAWRLLDREKHPGLRLPRFDQLMVAMLALPLLCAVSGKSIAGVSDQALPGQALLNELETRLILPPECLPECAAIQTMKLQIDSRAYRATLWVHADEPVAIPLPVDVTRSTPLSVTLNDKAPAKLMRQDEQLWLQVPKGIVQVRIAIGLPPGSEATIPLPLKPHRVEVEADGWSVEGVGKDQVPGAQLNLTRQQRGEEPGEDENFSVSNTLPAFVRVERELQLGNNWSVTTRVVRQTATGSPVTLHLPLMAGESVISETVQVKQGQVVVALPAQEKSVSWRSNLAIGAHLELIAAETDQYVEVWRVNVGPIWHITTEGIPPVQRQAVDGRWVPTWQPWPGERVALTVVRPEAVEGSSVTIDQSQVSIQPGQRVTQGELSLSLRASRGGKHEIRLPEDAQIQSVAINGNRVTIRPEQGKLALPVVPGSQKYAIVWRQPTGTALRWKSPDLSLGADSVNANIRVALPEDRWSLWVDGPRMGPAILFWSLLFVVLLAALILGRATSAFLPLSTLSWFLLGIGLTQVSIFSAMAVIAWFLLLHYRTKLDPAAHPKRFNLVQVGVVILTLIFIGILIWSVQQGLLGYPSMQIEGNGSSAYALNWYQDRVAETYPQVSVISVPLLVYRGLMLVWALWLAFSLLAWLKWGWGAFSKGGVYWKAIKIELGGRKPRRSPKTEAAPEESKNK